MIETITITKRGDLRVAKTSKRSYFMVNDDKEREFICFNQSAFNEMPVGAGVAVEITERGDQTPTIDLITEGAEKPEKPLEKPLQPVPPKPDKFGEGQREGMCWKEIGELFRTGKIVTLFGKENAMTITKEYRTYLLGVLKLPFDGDKLPQWKKEG